MEDKPSTKLTKAQYIKLLLGKVEQAKKEGKSIEDAIAVLTEKQYDFLIDNNIDFDNQLLTPEQLKVCQQIKRAPRRCSPEGYNKKYPIKKQKLYNAILEFIKSYDGAEVIPRQKQNYRDLDFTINGVKHRIVLSNPHT